MNLLTQPSALKWLFVDMNSYFASCKQQVDPSLRGKPMIVAPVMTDTTSAIAASYEAKAFGIKTGTPIWEVKKKCPDLKIVPARHKLYMEMHHKFVDAIESCLPVEKVVSIDEVACRLDKVLCEPEKAKALAMPQAILHLTPRDTCGIGPNMESRRSSSGTPTRKPCVASGAAFKACGFILFCMGRISSIRCRRRRVA